MTKRHKPQDENHPMDGEFDQPDAGAESAGTEGRGDLDAMRAQLAKKTRKLPS